LHHLKTGGGVFRFGFTPFVDPENQVLRLLASAVYVFTEVYNVHHMP
jgi:hypothetical protein